MSVQMKDQKMLWGRAAGRCAKPDCRLDLYEDETEVADATHVGENCHIVADADNGPRADPAMPLEQRNSYANLILMCRNHHKVIDSQVAEYTVEKLHRMKKDHENWVKQQLGFDAEKQRNDENYAEIIDEWERLGHINDWHQWSSWVLGNGQPSLSKEIDEDLYILRDSLLRRIWPEQYQSLDDAFSNFWIVLQDFQETFRKHAEMLNDNKTLMTKKFYRINEWNDELYHRLGREFDSHVDLVQDLMLELTRSANLICDRIREVLSHKYRLQQGRLMVESGPTINMTFQKIVAQYSKEEKEKRRPYPGLNAFLIERTTRDVHFGGNQQP